MKTSVLTVGFALATLFTAQAFAQKDAPSEGRVAPAAQPSAATKTQAAAKGAQKPGAARAQSEQAGDDRPATAPKNAAAAKKPLPKAKPGAAGSADTKAKKNDVVGPAS